MIKYLIMDIDGSLTDGKIYMGPNGEAMKAFSIKDGYVFKYILKPQNIVPVIITARSSSIVKHRCEELGISEVYQGKKDKFGTLKEIVGDEGLKNCAYFGDDVIDIQCMEPIKKAGGIVACPNDSVTEVKEISDYICMSKAGNGALREFVEWLVTDKIDEELIEFRVNKAIDYLQKLEITKLDKGKTVVVNENFFYSIQDYETKIIEQHKFESHRKHIEIQIITQGKEYMELVNISRLTIDAYDEEKDAVYWKTPQRINKITLGEGDCVVLYPEMAHRESMKLGNNGKLIRIVGKIKL